MIELAIFGYSNTQIEYIAGEAIAAALFGVAIGALLKHTFKWGIILGAIIIIMVVLGYVQPSIIISLVSLLAPEFNNIQNSLGAFNLPVDLVLLAIGFSLGLWKG